MNGEEGLYPEPKIHLWTGNKNASITTRTTLKAGIKEPKRRHQQRLERDPNTNSTKDMWQVSQHLTGYKSCESTVQDELNTRFLTLCLRITSSKTSVPVRLF